MRRFGIFGSAVLTSLALLHVPATAGGGWWSYVGLDGQYIGIGESLRLRVSEVWFETMEDTERARHVDYHAYLVRRFDQRALQRALNRAEPGRWWKPLSDVIRIGRVELINWDANIARARVRLNVPEISAGSYYLMLCDAGCRTALGNLIPSRVHVIDDPVVARTSRKLHGTNARLDLALARVRNELRDTRRELRGLKADAAQASETVARLEDPPVPPPDPPTIPWLAYAGWFIGGAAVMLAASRRRHRGPTAPAEPVVAERPDDAPQLIEIR